MNIQELKKARQRRRKKHVRKKIKSDTDRYRLTVTRTLKHVYAQIIDDVEGKTLVSASTVDKELRDNIKDDMKKIDRSKLVGETIARRALEADIKDVAFDRNGFLYHGRIKAIADAARKAGLNF